jgi:hypothetical protein
MPSASPAGSSGTGAGPTANVFTPMNQPQADSSFWSTLQPLIDASAGGGVNTPGGVAYPQAQQVVGQYLTNPALQGQAMAGAQQGAAIGGPASLQMGADANTLSAAAGQVLNQGFDPQSALLGREQNQLLDRSNVVNAMSGVASTPYGASTTGNNLANFNINWDNQRLQRGQSGLASAGAGMGQAGNLATGATSLAASSGGLPYSTGATIASDALSGLGSQTNLGNNQYLLPQQTLQDLESYLHLGQSASNISGQLGQLGLNQQANAMSGFGQLAGAGSNALFGSGGVGGSGGLLGTGGNGIGSLFGSGGGAASSWATDAAGAAVPLGDATAIDAGGVAAGAGGSLSQGAAPALALAA